MKKLLMTALTLSAFFAGTRAFADCTVSKDGNVIAQAPQIELTVINVSNNNIIEIRNDQVSMSVELRRPATAAEIKAAKGSYQEVGLDFDGVVVDSKTIGAEQLNSRMLKANVGGYAVSCNLDK